MNVKVDWQREPPQWRVWLDDDPAPLTCATVAVMVPAELKDVNGHGWLFIEDATIVQYPARIEIYRNEY